MQMICVASRNQSSRPKVFVMYNRVYMRMPTANVDNNMATMMTPITQAHGGAPSSNMVVPPQQSRRPLLGGDASSCQAWSRGSQECKKRDREECRVSDLNIPTFAVEGTVVRPRVYLFDRNSSSVGLHRPAESMVCRWCSDWVDAKEVFLPRDCQRHDWA